MYEELVKALRCCADDNIPCKSCPRCARCVKDMNMSSLFPEAADAIEGLGKLAEAIPHKCKCCIGCEIEQKNGGCETGFVLSPERAKAYIEENLDWWRKFRALMEAMGMPLPTPPKEET